MTRLSNRVVFAWSTYTHPLSDPGCPFARGETDSV